MSTKELKKRTEHGLPASGLCIDSDRPRHPIGPVNCDLTNVTIELLQKSANTCTSIQPPLSQLSLNLILSPLGLVAHKDASGITRIVSRANNHRHQLAATAPHVAEKLAIETLCIRARLSAAPLD